MSTPGPGPAGSKTLLTLRAAVIVLIALLVGIATGTLTLLAGQALAASVIVGGGAFGASLVWVNKIVD